MSLRSKVIRLAHANPALRPHLLCVLASDRFAIDFPTPSALKKYLKEHPNADAAKHSVVDRDREMPRGPDAEKAGEILTQWAAGGDIFNQVGTKLLGRHDVAPEKIAEAHKRVTMMLAHPEEHRLTKEDVRDLKKVEKFLGKHLPKEEPKPKFENLKTKTFKKRYPGAVSEVMTKHKLTDTDADAVKEFKKQKPRKGTEVSDAELMRRFMAKASPETKERMKGMSPAEFKVMLAAISEDDEGGKTAAELRSFVIRLAHANPDIRGSLLPIIPIFASEP